jgi:hypothetical protein
LFILLNFILIGELIAIFILMRRIESKEVFAEWIKLCTVFSVVWIVVLDSIACLIFTLVFMKALSIRSGFLRLMAGLLVCNIDERALMSVNLEIKGRVN